MRSEGRWDRRGGWPEPRANAVFFELVRSVRFPLDGLITHVVDPRDPAKAYERRTPRVRRPWGFASTGRRRDDSRMKDLAGKVAVVTGAGSGIGRAVALELAGAGVHVVVSDLDPGSAQLVADEVSRLGVRGLAIETDVGDRASVEALAETAWSEFGAVHVLHNNAGIALLLLLENTTDADWDLIFRVNLLGVVNGIQAFLPRMKAMDGERHIVCTASMSGIAAFPTLGAYTATKYAVVGICETLRQEVAADNIGVSVLCPGPVSTNILVNSDKQRPDAFADAMLIAGEARESELNYSSPEDVARLVRIAVEENELYIFTHPDLEAAARMRFDAIARGYERLAERIS